MRILLLLCFLAVNAIATAQTAEFVEGKDYTLLDPAQPTNSGDRIEVVEVFNYACGACALMQPLIDEWKPKLAADVQLQYLPAVFGAVWEIYARAYFAAESMAVLERSHAAIFKAVHVERREVRSMEDVAGLYSNYGVDPAAMVATMQSFAINAKIARSKQQVPRYGVTGTPTLIVNGKYRIEVSQDGGYEKMLRVADFLIAKERASKA